MKYLKIIIMFFVISCTRKNEVILSNDVSYKILDTGKIHSNNSTMYEFKNGLQKIYTFNNNKLVKILTLDTNNIIRKVSWFHGYDTTFYTFEAPSMFLFKEIEYNKQFVDTSCIYPAIVNYSREDGVLYLEVMPVNYPSKLTEINMFNFAINRIQNAKSIHINNTIYFEIAENKKQDSMLIEYKYVDGDGNYIKEHKRMYYFP